MINRKTRYNWPKIRKYAETHTVRETAKKFGFVSSTWWLAIQKGRIKPKPWKKTLKSLKTHLTKNSKYNPACLKTQIIKNNLIEHKRCVLCNQGRTWKKKPLVLILDHINGIKNDARLSNLRFVCPNCDSQLSTFKGRNINKNKIKNKIK